MFTSIALIEDWDFHHWPAEAVLDLVHMTVEPEYDYAVFTLK